VELWTASRSAFVNFAKYAPFSASRVSQDVGKNARCFFLADEIERESERSTGAVFVRKKSTNGESPHRRHEIK